MKLPAGLIKSIVLKLVLLNIVGWSDDGSAVMSWNVSEAQIGKAHSKIWLGPLSIKAQMEWALLTIKPQSKSNNKIEK